MRAPIKLIFLLLACALACMPANTRAAERPPQKNKRLLVVSVSLGLRHSSIETAERALQEIAAQSKAFEIVEFLQQPKTEVLKKPTAPEENPSQWDPKDSKRIEQSYATYDELMSKWTRSMELKSKRTQAEFDAELESILSKLSVESLESNHIDGIVFLNTTGELPLPDRHGLLSWIAEGRAFIGIHSAADTLHFFPAYAEMLGGESAAHGSQTALDLQLANPKHPALQGLPNPWKIAMEEFLHFRGHNRAKNEDLLFSNSLPMDGRPGQGNREIFPVAWVRKHQNGRVFYTSLGHRADLWSLDPQLPYRINPVATSKQFRDHILGGISWALGLEAAK